MCLVTAILNRGDSGHFAEGSIRILSYLNCDYLVFGSENNDIDLFNRLVDTQLYNTEYDKYDHYEKGYIHILYLFFLLLYS